jgi:predicted nuclease of predicted toxin-antitoxin system
LKIRADEHVSKEIVRAVREMALSPGWELSHVVEEGDKGTADDHWITRFANDGGHAILTADSDFFSLPVQVVAVLNTGVKVIHLPHKWANASCHLQAAHILLWWKRIEKKVTEMKARECYRPPWNINESGDLKQVKIDYAEAQKKQRKRSRRSE